MPPIIQVSNLSKSYSITHEGRERYTSLRDVIARNTKKIFSFPKSMTPASASKEEFWALKDVSFDIEQGDRVGIIGRNGAGKSTLLKILSRITEPTTGSIKIKGRVASLLEVGTGFHPELTGRENIYLNGAILGMSRAEIKKHFDAIVDFAETEKFLDTPVKRYSSGMYVRLAFAVAAHLEPEILIVDEVLAVGDVQFQKKCLGKMEDVSKNQGRTVLFVSHQIDAIKRLCTKAIILKNGSIAFQGETINTINDYMVGNTRASGFKSWDGDKVKPGDSFVNLIDVRVLNSKKVVSDVFLINEDIFICFKYEVIDEILPLIPGVNLYNSEGYHVFSSHDFNAGLEKKGKERGIYEATVCIPNNFLAEGFHSLSVAMMSYSPFEVHFHEAEAASFTVLDQIGLESVRGMYSGIFPGIVRPKLEWTSKMIKLYET